MALARVQCGAAEPSIHGNPSHQTGRSLAPDGVASAALGSICIPRCTTICCQESTPSPYCILLSRTSLGAHTTSLFSFSLLAGVGLCDVHRCANDKMQTAVEKQPIACLDHLL